MADDTSLFEEQVHPDFQQRRRKRDFPSTYDSNEEGLDSLPVVDSDCPFPEIDNYPEPNGLQWSEVNSDPYFNTTDNNNNNTDIIFGDNSFLTHEEKQTKNLQEECTKLLEVFYQIGRDEPHFLLNIVNIVHDPMASKSNEDGLYLIKTMFETTHNMISNPQLFSFIKNTTNATEADLLFLELREIAYMLNMMSDLQLLTLTNTLVSAQQPIREEEDEFKKFHEIQDIFKKWGENRVLTLSRTIRNVPAARERQTLLKEEPKIPWELLNHLLQLLRMDDQNILDFNRWFKDIAQQSLLCLLNMMQLDSNLLLQFKQQIDPILSPEPYIYPSLETSLRPVNNNNNLTNHVNNSLPVHNAEAPKFSSLAVPSQAPLSSSDYPDSSTTNRLPDLYQSSLSLKIARQPPSKIVYQRILRPFPVVRLEGDPEETGQNNLFVEATLIKQDSEEEVIPNILEGNRCVRITQGVFSVFKKLKIQATSQQQQTLFRLKFSLKRYLENSFQLIPDATVTSEPIEVFSHSLYLDRHSDSTRVPPPIITEIVPPLAKAGARVALLGSNFSNTPNTLVSLNDQFRFTPEHHEQCTLLFTVPDVPPGDYTLAVTNDASFFCEGKPFTIID